MVAEPKSGTNDRQDDPDSTPFLSFDRGAAFYPLPNIPETLDELLHKAPSNDEIAKVLADASPWNASKTNTWLLLLREVHQTLTEDSVLTFDLRQFLVAIRRHTEISLAWDAAKKMILEELYPILENRGRSRHFLEPGETVVRRDGKYFIEHDGSMVSQIVGLRTSAEEEFGYIRLETTRDYGRIHALLALFSLYAIALDFRQDESGYDPTVRALLGSSDDYTWYSRWRWCREEPYTWHPCSWRPRSALCDPTWLAEDLLSAYARKRGLRPEQKPTDPPEQLRPASWESGFRGFDRQIEVALDTGLLLGREDEFYFEFEGRTMRWVNGTGRLSASIIAPMRATEDYSSQHERVKRCLSQLVYEFRQPISEITSIGSPKRFRPMLQQPRHMVGMLIPEPHFQERSGLSDKELMALAFYREGVSTESSLYAFLNHYKIVELACGREGKPDEWIEEHLDPQTISGLIEWQEKYVKDDSPGAVLRHANRNAIAHVGTEGRLWDGTPVMNPDSLEKLGVVFGSAGVMRSLAEIGLGEMLRMADNGA